MARWRSATGTDSSGFTLIEILVALAILSIAFAAIFGAIDGAGRQTRMAEAATLHVLAARSLIDATLAEPDPSSAGRTGVLDDGVPWRIETSLISTAGGPDADTRTSGAPRAWRIVLTLGDPERPELTLETVGLDRATGAPR